MKADPDAVVVDDGEDGLDGRGVNQFIPSLETSFALPEFNKVGEYLMLREREMKLEKEELEARMKKILDESAAQIQKQKIENEFLERKSADEVLEKLLLEEDLRKCEREREDLEEKVNRLSEDQRIMCDREKRGEGRYTKLMEELKKSEEYNAQLNCKNRELECEKRRVEAEIDVWKKRFGELEPRVLALERDMAVLKRPEPNFCERMNGDLGVPNAVFSGRRAENLANKKFKQNGGNSILASPGVGSSCHTPTQRIIDFQSEGNERHAFGESVDVSDGDDDMPEVIKNASTYLVSKGTSEKQQPSQSMKNVSLLSGKGTGDANKRKQEILGCLGEETTLKVKQASSLIRNPVFLKRLKATMNAEENIWDTYDISDSDDTSDSQSESDGGFPFDPLISIARSNQEGGRTQLLLLRSPG